MSDELSAPKAPRAFHEHQGGSSDSIATRVFRESAKRLLYSIFKRNILRFIRLSTFGMVIIHIFRRPTWTYYMDNSNDTGIYPGWGVSVLSTELSYFLDVLCTILLLYCIYTLLKDGGSYGRGDDTISKERTLILRYCTLPLCVVKLIECIIQILTSIVRRPRMFVMSPIEGIILITMEPCFESTLYKTMYRSLPYFGGLMFIFSCVILSWSALAKTFFGTQREINESTDHNEAVYFDGDLGKTTWTMIILLNTSNWPDPIIPIYEMNTNYFLFFFFYCVVVDWGFMNLVLGLVVSFFEQSWERSKGKEDVSEGSSSSGAIELSNKQLQEAVTLVTEKAGWDSEGGIEMREFSVFADTNPMHAEGVQGEKADKDITEEVVDDTIPQSSSQESVKRASTAPQVADQDPTVTRSLARYSPFLVKMQKYVHSRYFDIISDLILLIFVLVFILSDSPKTMLRAQIGINSVEISLRVLLRETADLYEWFRSPRNFANICYIAVLVLLSIIYFSYCGVHGHLRFTEGCTDHALNRHLSYSWDHHVVFAVIAIRALIIIRSTFVLRNFSWDFLPEWLQRELARAFDIVAETSMSLRHLVLMVAVVMYSFAAIGQMVFGGRLNKDPASSTHEKLLESPYARAKYWPLNFNDMPSGFVSVFTLLYVNNMDILASGCEAVTGSWANLYFVAFWVLGVLFLRNIFTSFLWSRIGKILDKDYKPCKYEPPKEGDYLRKFFSSLYNLRDKYDSIWNHMHSVVKTRSRRVMQIQASQMSVIESVGVLMHYCRQGETHNLFKSRLALNAYRIRHKHVYPLLLCCWTLTFLRVFQRPYWMLGKYEEMSETDAYDRTTQVAFLSKEASTAIKVPILFVMVYFLCVEIVYKSDGGARARDMHVSVVIRYIILSIATLSICASIGASTGNVACLKLDWILSFMSVFYTLWFDRNALKRLYVVLGVVPMALFLTLLICVFVMAAAGFSRCLFDTEVNEHDDDVADTHGYYNGDYANSMWSTFTALTSSSFPSQFMGPYREFREYALYFVPVTLIGGFIILEGSIGFINNAYSVSTNSLLKSVADNREGVMKDIFDILRHASGTRVAEETVLSKLVEKMEEDGTMATLTESNGLSESKAFSAQESEGGSDKKAQKSTRVSLKLRRSLARSVSGLKSKDEATRDSSSVSPSTAYPVRSSAQPKTGCSELEIRKMSVKQLTEVLETTTLHYVEKDNSIESSLSFSHVHGAVLDDLLEEIFSHYNEFKKFNFNFLRHNVDPYLMIILRNVADVNGDGYITSDDFRLFLIVCRLKVTRVGMGELTLHEKSEKRRNRRREMLDNSGNTDVETSFERIYYVFWNIRRLAYRHLMSRVRNVVDIERKYWDVIWDSIASLLGLGVLLSSIDSDSAQSVLLVLLYVFVTLEAFFKVFFIGWNHYQMDTRNRMDMGVWVAMSIVLVTGMHQVSITVSRSLKMTTELVACIRLLLYPRNISCFVAPVDGIEWENVIITIGALTFAFAEGFVSFWFTYAQLGVFIFGGTMPEAGENVELDNSRFGQSNFFILNFNNMVFSFSTLFCCLRVSSFDVVAEGFEIVMNSRMVRLYFLFWYSMGTLLFFNVLKSYFISVFQPGEEKGGADVAKSNQKLDAHIEEKEEDLNEEKSGGSIEKNEGMTELDGKEIGVEAIMEEDEDEEEAETEGVRSDKKGSNIPIAPLKSPPRCERKRSPSVGAPGRSRGRRQSLGFANYTPSTLRNSLCDDEEIKDISSLAYYDCDDVEDDMLEAMNNSGELIIDVNELKSRPRYVEGLKDITGEAQEAQEMQRERGTTTEFQNKFIVQLPFKVNMEREDRLRVLRRVYSLSLEEFKYHHSPAATVQDEQK